MRVYVAGKFQNVARVREVITWMKRLGYEVTHDWTGEDFEKVPEAERDHQARVCAKADFYGATNCDVLFLINHTPPGSKPTQGRWIEMGLAAASGADIIIVNEGWVTGAVPESPGIFAYLSGVYQFDTLDKALDFVSRRYAP